MRQDLKLGLPDSKVYDLLILLQEVKPAKRGRFPIMVLLAVVLGSSFPPSTSSSLGWRQ